ncbi:coiled-coil domain-containing protein 89 [Chiloscyllium punctatum]|uniref:coiled-coil domain-containing protein 89 n=1 Tax=Chiloscyllium punctatum TaxID=137246 RepID=UPI003B639B75
MERQEEPQKTARDFDRLVQDSKQEIDTVQVTLEKLRGLSQDDKTENALLRSRIDEQSQLICILKRRADEFLLRCQALETINTELENQHKDLKQQLENQLKQSAQLEARFMDLAFNHQEIIKFKDEYKSQNAELRKQNEKLRRENESIFCKALGQKDDEILKLSNELGNCLKQCKALEQECNEVTLNLQRKENEFLQQKTSTEKFYLNEVQSLRAKLKESEDRCNVAELKQKEAEENRCHEETELLHKLHELSKEKEELLTLSMQRGKIIQDKEKDVQQLEEKLRLTEKARKKAEDRFQYEAAVVNSNVKVKELQQQYQKSQEAYADLEREFEAFKKHSNDLLTKEKEVNEKIRHLIE